MSEGWNWPMMRGQQNASGDNEETPLGWRDSSLNVAERTPRAAKAWDRRQSADRPSRGRPPGRGEGTKPPNRPESLRAKTRKARHGVKVRQHLPQPCAARNSARRSAAETVAPRKLHNPQRCAAQNVARNAPTTHTTHHAQARRITDQRRSTSHATSRTRRVQFRTRLRPASTPHPARQRRLQRSTGRTLAVRSGRKTLPRRQGSTHTRSDHFTRCPLRHRSQRTPGLQRRRSHHTYKGCGEGECG